MKRWVCMHLTVIGSFYPAFIFASPWLRELCGHFTVQSTGVRAAVPDTITEL